MEFGLLYWLAYCSRTEQTGHRIPYARTRFVTHGSNLINTLTRREHAKYTAGYHTNGSWTNFLVSQQGNAYAVTNLTNLDCVSRLWTYSNGQLLKLSLQSFCLEVGSRATAKASTAATNPSRGDDRCWPHAVPKVHQLSQLLVRVCVICTLAEYIKMYILLYVCTHISG